MPAPSSAFIEVAGIEYKTVKTYTNNLYSFNKNTTKIRDPVKTMLKMVKLKLQYLANRDTFEATREYPFWLVWSMSGPVK